MDSHFQSMTDNAFASVKVSGWLLVLCVILTFIYPATSLYQIFLHSIPTLIVARALNRIFLLGVYCVMFGAMAAFSFVAGLKLWLAKPHALGFVRRFLLTYFIANAAYFVFWIAVTWPTKQIAYAEMGWYHLVGPALFVYFWHTYLEHSKRVCHTYPMS